MPERNGTVGTRASRHHIETITDDGEENAMAQDTKRSEGRAPNRPIAESVDREPSGEPTPEDTNPPVDHEDGPKGHPTSDRFHTEQAHKTSEEDVKGS